ncbi:cytochrome P450 [Allokutzneria sp. A3M-2-11 16]|uniref:cytochrome P450 n=1 Tax=Allokutzneria sp. A3M-2-11 16 TaxID=2962043 RepID=UPI0020B69240|nr:cytochrome P450 [Allokutzneria sp. A3M-2-11 16]MCP3803434.1 cytochrome P450 [Allokutzneria sp. A3M-2-11 16]
MADAVGLIRSLLLARTPPDPYPVYEALRADPGVHHFAPLDAYLVTRHADCAALHRDRSLRVINGVQQGRRRVGQWPPEILASIEQWPVYRNPPGHSALRQAAAPYFTPSRVAALRAFVERECERALDELARHGRDGTAVDLVPVLAAVPMRTMVHVLGLPAADVGTLVELMSEFSLLFEVVLSQAQNRRLAASHGRLVAYYLDRIAAARTGRFADLVAHWSDVGGGKSPRQVAGMLAGLMLAGFETSLGLLGNGARALALHPDQARLLAHRPELAEAAVEEVLRWDSPVQVNTRLAGRTMAVAGTVIPEGAVVGLVYGSAHRDPDRYPDPDRFDITRTGVRPLSFGFGVHHCVGSQLARMEAAVVLAALARRFPRLRLAGTPTLRQPCFTIRALQALPVRTA